MPHNAITIAFFLVGVVLLVFGLRIIIRRRASLTFRSSQVGKADLKLNLVAGPALLWGAALLVLGLRIVGAYALTWQQGGDFDDLSFGGGITIWAIIALLAAVAWHIAGKARSTFENPEFQKKISDKIQQARDEKDKN